MVGRGVPRGSRAAPSPHRRCTRPHRRGRRVRGRIRSEDVASEIAGLVGLRDRGVQAPQHRDGLPPQVDERVPGADRVGGDDHAFDEGVRGGQHERDVLAGARFGFVGVDDEIVRLVVALGDERPLGAGGESGAAATADPGVLHRGDDRIRVHPEGDGQGFVSAVPPVGVEGPRLVLVPVAGEYGGQTRR